MKTVVIGNTGDAFITFTPDAREPSDAQIRAIAAFEKTTARAVMERINAAIDNQALNNGPIPGVKVPTQPAPPPTIRRNDRNSITALNPLIPVRVASQQPLEGDWVGEPLDAVRAIPSNFGGVHYILQIGRMLPLGGPEKDAQAFRIEFVVSLPVEKCTEAAKVDALDAANGLMHMLNLRRRA